MEDLEEYYDYDNILQRLLDKVPDEFDKREGSIIYDALAPCAAELAQMYIVLSNNIDLVFIDTAIDEYLDRLVGQMGITRNQATKSIRKGVFKSSDGIALKIENGTRFSVDNIEFKVIEEIQVGEYKLECSEAGSIGNTVEGMLIPVDYNVRNLGSATLEEILIPGDDKETDEELRERYYNAMNEKSFSGNIADYKKKTKEIDGVGLVKVTPVWNGGGTVKLTILDSNYNKASTELVENVQEIICPNQENSGKGLAPIGHIVTVDTVHEVQIIINTEIIITEGTEVSSVLDEIKSEINKYLLDLRKSWENETKLIVRISQIESRILNATSVIDIANTTINGGTSNIELLENQIPILQEVTIL